MIPKISGADFTGALQTRQRTAAELAMQERVRLGLWRMELEVSGLKTALALAWASLIAAAIAIGLVLHRATQFSERRAAFVSAVTHELRTLLTTFRLYLEMLAHDVVAGEEQRKSYLDTLHLEANRLMHLVENVLSFSGIERGPGLSAARDSVRGCPARLAPAPARRPLRSVRLGSGMRMR